MTNASISLGDGKLPAVEPKSLHKGTCVKTGHRLVLQLLYSTNGFGGAVDPVILNDRFSSSFIKTVSQFPRIYSARFQKEAV